MDWRDARSIQRPLIRLERVDVVLAIHTPTHIVYTKARAQQSNSMCPFKTFSFSRQAQRARIYYTLYSVVALCDHTFCCGMHNVCQQKPRERTTTVFVIYTHILYIFVIYIHTRILNVQIFILYYIRMCVLRVMSCEQALLDAIRGLSGNEFSIAKNIIVS